MRALLVATFVAMFSVAAFVAVSGCGGSPSPVATPYALPTISPPPTVSHMYVQYGSDVAEYALPLTSASVPDAIVATSASAFAVYPFTGQLAVVQSAGIAMYNAPLGPNKAPAFTIPYNNASTPNTSRPPSTSKPPTSFMSLAFDPFGNLWVCSDALREFTAPLSAQEVSLVANTGLPVPLPNGAIGSECFTFMEFDANGTLYGALPAVFSPAGGATLVFSQSLAAPYSTSPKTITSPFQLGPAPLAFDASGDAMASYQTIDVTIGTPTPSPVPTSVPSSGIGVFTLPIGPSALPYAVVPTPAPSAYLVADAAEPVAVPTHLYIGNQNDGSIYVYTLPLQNGAAPIAQVPCPSTMVTPANCKLLLSQVFQFGP